MLKSVKGSMASAKRGVYFVGLCSQATSHFSLLLTQIHVIIVIRDAKDLTSRVERSPRPLWQHKSPRAQKLDSLSFELTQETLKLDIDYLFN